MHDSAEYDDPNDWRDGPLGGPSASAKAFDKVVRRRSSKGPSRKRGPPKGYIDAIESRLHQTEALVGILLAVNDTHALLDDLTQDPLAREIIERVDKSPYGIKGRTRGADASGSNSSSARVAPPPSPNGNPAAGNNNNINSNHYSNGEGAMSSQNSPPSNEWQDRLANRINALALVRKQNAYALRDSFSRSFNTTNNTNTNANTNNPNANPSALTTTTTNNAHMTYDSDSRSLSPARRQRRRLDPTLTTTHIYPHSSSSRSPCPRNRATTGVPMTASMSAEELRQQFGGPPRKRGRGSRRRCWTRVRRTTGWWRRRFPKARVWLPLPWSGTVAAKNESEDDVRLPEPPIQKHLLDLYFTYVHPVLPVVHKQTSLEDFWNGLSRSLISPPVSMPNSDRIRAGRRIARFEYLRPELPRHDLLPSPTHDRDPTPPPPRHVLHCIVIHLSGLSAAGSVDRRDVARGRHVPRPCQGVVKPHVREFASSRSSTCQALLLMGYREIGIGAMAQAWIYVGMAVRMMQDLGLHMSADRWQHIGAWLFSPAELQERRQIWYACVIMDKYVSTYIGRPLSIFERDFNTELPTVEELEELEVWRSHPTDPQLYGEDVKEPELSLINMTGHIISCFNASATLSIIPSKIVQVLYSVRRGPGRHAESLRLEELLNKWYLDLPDYLRCDPAGVKRPVPPAPPHVLTLHMQYWSNVREDPEVLAISQKNYDQCVQAANHITSIVEMYKDHFCIKRAPVFLSYYVFTAGLMHVTTLNSYPDDLQARVGLVATMAVLKALSVIWPSAGRAWELLHGSHMNGVNGHGAGTEMVSLTVRGAHHKRSAEHFLEDVHFFAGAPLGGRASSNAIPSQGYPLVSLTSSTPLASSPAPHSTSTAAQYSTGFVDERGRGVPQETAGGGGQRYPQYWNGYSTLGQLSALYGVPILHEQVWQQQGKAQVHASQQMYLQD
ncbi:hypothetical protein EW146_g8047 [Bondarzewia mesenterica]|uniref:Xylanolytic transcriptional activator regulatory domain-containing protein n=1 Tax=Bondarzewia mesenterica TaxID=1095465 RepID=A0A4S4LHG9_9AGAM|nr:hypothetical protein EW146_g8047 [Bondarzewia mesenterica]